MFLGDWLFHGWSSWIDLGAATLLILGGLAYRLHRNLKQPKRLLVFAALIVVHCAAFVHLFTQAFGFDPHGTFR
jgi:hypothetical protein